MQIPADTATAAEWKLLATTSADHFARALRQLKRLRRAQAAVSRYEAELNEAAGNPGEMTITHTHLHTKSSDHVYFFVVSAQRAVKAAETMRRIDPHFPQIRQSNLIGPWRHFEEHWEDPFRGQEIRALSEWSKASDDVEPNLSASYVCETITHISGVDLNQLKRDLKAAKRTALSIQNELWEHLYLSPTEAAALLGCRESDLRRIPLQSFDAGGANDGVDNVRLFREQIESLRDSGDLMPKSWQLANERLRPR